MKVTLDDERCRGHGVCVSWCPEVFTLTDDGYAEAVDTEIPAHQHAVVIDAAKACPEQAIEIIE